MGRPLKIAKAQAVITLTATNGTSERVTTSASLSALGIIAGMPFVPASNIGGLVSGTTYWILKVLSDTTFTVSATPLNANPTSTPVNLSATSAQTVAATVAPVDTYFNNPNGSANTYSVVGGNTAIIGNQVLGTVAIGQNGVGTIYTRDPSQVLSGIGTDFGNTVVANSWIGTSDGTTIGYVSTVNGPLTINVTDTTASTDEVTVDDSSGLPINGAIQFADDIGGLTAGTVYFVKTKPSGTTITVSATIGGDTLALTDDTVTTTAIHDSVTLAAAPEVDVTNGGFQFANPEAGYIVRQKGKQKYLVKGTTSGLVGAVYTFDGSTGAQPANSIVITATDANAATVYVQSLSDHNAELFTADSGPIATGNIVLQDADPAYASFNAAAAANAANGQPYPIVTVNNA